MDADNYVGQCGPAVGCIWGWVAVVGGQVTGPFASQGEAEDAYRRLRGETGGGGAAGPGPGYAGPCGDALLACGAGQGAPVAGGCWCCRGGCWQTDPAFCREPLCHECGNGCGGGGGSGGVGPQPGAPTSPGSSLPPGSESSASPAAAPVLHVSTAQLAAAAVVALALLLRSGG